MEKILPEINKEKADERDVKVILYENYSVSVKNKDVHLGHYYAEDNWDITVYGLTEEEIIEKLAYAFFNNFQKCRINPEYFHIQIVKICEVIDPTTGETMLNKTIKKEDVFTGEDSSQKIRDFQSRFYHSEAFKTEEKKYEEKMERLESMKKRMEEKEEREKERKQLVELLKKYPDVHSF